MLLKIITIVLLLVILYCLGSGLVFLVRDGKGTTRMAKALTWRIVLSICLFLFLMMAYFLGWIVPHGIVPVAS